MSVVTASRPAYHHSDVRSCGRSVGMSRTW